MATLTRLPAGASFALAREIATAEPGTLFVLGAEDGVRALPEEGTEVLFGRHRSEVAVCVGGDDTKVSRRQGLIVRRGTRWMINNLGQPPIRLSSGSLLHNGSWSELAGPHVPLFVGGKRRSHLLDVRIAGRTGRPGVDVSSLDTTRDAWPLTEQQRLVVTCLAERYLLEEQYAQPQTWKLVADRMSHLDPAGRWDWRHAARVVESLRDELTARGVPGLQRTDDIPEPVGNVLNHNLIMELLVTTTITPQDLAAIDTD